MNKQLPKLFLKNCFHEKNFKNIFQPFLTIYFDLFQVMESLVHMFSALTTIAFCLTMTATFLVKDRPLTPPSVAQAKIRETTTNSEEESSTITKFFSTIKKLFSNKVFIATWFVCGLTGNIFRCNTVLFTSILRKNFLDKSDLNIKSGLSLLIGWVVFIVGSFIAGPLITKTKAYKGMVVFSLTTLLISCILILIGLKIDNLKLSFFSVVMQGFFSGISNTSNYELLAEVIYPIKPMSACMIVLFLSGITMLILFITGRLLLSSLGPLWSMALSIAMTGLGLFIVLLTKPTYFREKASNGISEETQLISDSEKK